MRIDKDLTRNRMVFMVLSSDHITGATGKTLTVNISKNGGAFSPVAGDVSEVSDGWYLIELTSADTDTLGDLAYHITAADCDPTDLVDEVINQVATAADLAIVGAAASSASTNASVAATSAGLVLKVNTASSLGTTSRLNDTTLTEADGYWVGCRLRPIGGANAGLQRKIVESGNGYVVVSPGFPSALANGIAYHIFAGPADPIKYAAKVTMTDDDAAGTPADRYAVQWFRDLTPIEEGADLTDPEIRVIKESDGSDLIAATALTEVGTTGIFSYNATTTERITDGAAYIVEVTAEIDGLPRVWRQPISRDSS